MPFTEDDLRELLLRLQGDAGARGELRNLLRDPVLEGVQETLAELAAAQRRTEERLAALTERVDELAAAQRRTEERLAELITIQRRAEERMDRLTDRLGALVGESLERRYRERAGAYFGRVLRRTRVLDSPALEHALEERLSADELQDTLLTDVVISGRPRTGSDAEEVWLAVEVSSVVDRDDVSRALRRGRLLARSGLPVIPVVAGEALTTGARDTARGEHVAVVENGKIANWDAALQAALGAA